MPRLRQVPVDMFSVNTASSKKGAVHGSYVSNISWEGAAKTWRDWSSHWNSNGGASRLIARVHQRTTGQVLVLVLHMYTHMYLPSACACAGPHTVPPTCVAPPRPHWTNCAHTRVMMHMAKQRCNSYATHVVQLTGSSRG